MANRKWIFAFVALFSTQQLFAADAVPGEYLIRLKKGTIRTQSQLSMLGSLRPSIAGHNLILVKRPTAETAKSAVESMMATGLVEIAEPNYLFHSVATNPDDSDFGRLWGMVNSGQADCGGNTGVAGVDVNAVKAWEVTTGSAEALVAVIDTGVNFDHADLVNNIYTNISEKNGKPGVDDDGNGFIDDVHGWDFVKNVPNGMDENGHGTHCSGTIAGVGNNGLGVVGASWNAKILPVRFLDADGSGSLEAAISAIDYATKMGAKIQSNSWGGGGYTQLLKEAIERANAAGVLFVAAAGNESNNNDSSPTYPASYEVPNILTVAAIDNKGAMASFSNYGKKSVHVAAPGVKIWSTYLNGYECLSGTSMATPHVSGVAALVAGNEPGLTGIEIKNRIISTVHRLRTVAQKTVSGGMIDAYAALMNIVTPPDDSDPSRWASVPYVAATEHPYANKTDQVFEVSVPSAKEISIYFTAFDLEQNFDKVEFFDVGGNKIGQMDGKHDEGYSDVFAGNYVKVRFTSDNSITRYGFEMSKIAYR